MRFATYQSNASGQGSTAARDGAPETSVRFGDELLVFADEAEWPALSARAESSGLAPKGRSGEFAEGEPYLVVQVGDLFRREHPDVPVLVNKGRYLAVALEPERARRLAEVDSRCFTVRPLKGGEVVFDVRQASAERAPSDAWVKALVGGVSRERVEASLTFLTSLPTRLSTGPHYAEAAEWAEKKLAALGYSTRLQKITVGGGESRNVIAEKRGAGAGRRGVVVVTAHLDSINNEGGDAAPGADDNGSGSAGLLEIARLLKDHAGFHDLRFILFGGEEQGLFGSRQYVASLPAAERERITAVVNMDMIATLNTEKPAVLLEGATVSRGVIDALAAAANAHTGLVVQTSLSAADSDHVSFIDEGIPAVLTIEGADRENHNVHSERDTLAHIDYGLMLEILRMNVAFVASAVGRQGGTPMFESHTPPRDEAAPRDAACAEEAGRAPAFQFSGCYKYNGGASAREGRSFVDRASGQSAAALSNPIYRLDEPVYLDSPDEYDEAERAPDQLRFTLGVDVDGSDPLGVVSGTVALGPASPGSAAEHFIGRVGSNAANGGGRVLTVGDFKFRWPGTNDSINQLTVELTGAGTSNPSARVTFSDTAQNRHHGPYTVPRSSMYFREVELDVDREKNAVDVEPFDTHTHPDRPSNLPRESLTLESAFAKAGIRITRSPGSGTVVDTSEAGQDRRWVYSELHDSMQLHWDAFANKPQWKMWLFLAERADSDSLGGVMFDGEIDEPGGVDRQGTAIFTRCPFFHTPAGGYIAANPPVNEAVRRELFFNLMHETGHAFNLAHSFQKEMGGVWKPPAWIPVKTDNQALSWMNYPDQATPVPGPTPNATWFYRRFRFRFDRGELLFLRHAPETYVEMGAQAWFQNHGRVARISLDPRLELTVSSRRTLNGSGRPVTYYELGEPVLLELKLRNVGGQPVTVHRNLDPSDGLVEVAVTNPRGERRPFLPIDHTRTLMQIETLEPGDESVYGLLDLTMGSFGFPFKEPGAYRVEAGYTNIDGGTAAAVAQLYVRPPAHYDAVPIVNELFDAKVGRTLYVDGTRVMGDVNEKLDWADKRLRDVLGKDNPVSMHLAAVRCLPLANEGKYVDPETGELRAAGEEPDRVVAGLTPVVVDQAEAAANTMGHIWYRSVVDTYTDAAEQSGERGKARRAQNQLCDLFRARGVVKSVRDEVEARAVELEGRAAGSNGNGSGRPAAETERRAAGSAAHAGSSAHPRRRGKN